MFGLEVYLDVVYAVQQICPWLLSLKFLQLDEVEQLFISLF